MIPTLVTIEDKHKQITKGIQNLNAKKVRGLMESYAVEREDMFYESLLKMIIEINEDYSYQENMLDCLHYLEMRCILNVR